MNIGAIHLVYILFVTIILIFMFMRRDVIVPSIIGLFVVGYIYNKNLLKAVQCIYRAIYISTSELIDVIIIISLLNAMAKMLKVSKVDRYLIYPLMKIIKDKNSAFLISGVVMLLCSLIIWPTPAIAFIGPLLLIPSAKVGLPAIWLGVALSIFGNGAALSSDIFIQAAPAITAKAAGIVNPHDIVKNGFLLWLIMSVSTFCLSYFMMLKDTKNYKQGKSEESSIDYIEEDGGKTKIVFLVTLIIFIANLFFMFFYDLKGKDSTALIGGTAVIITCIIAIMLYGFTRALQEVTNIIKEGFINGIKIFSPVIIIGAFFYLGSKETAQQILGSNTEGLLTELGLFISKGVYLNKYIVILVQCIIAAMLGVGGSGFAGLPLVGTLASVFSNMVPINKAGLAALGQIITIWVGGGTIIPWVVMPIASICDIDAFDIIKRNLIPVLVSMAITIVASFFIL